MSMLTYNQQRRLKFNLDWLWLHSWDDAFKLRRTFLKKLRVVESIIPKEWKYYTDECVKEIGALEYPYALYKLRSICGCPTTNRTPNSIMRDIRMDFNSGIIPKRWMLELRTSLHINTIQVSVAFMDFLEFTHGKQEIWTENPDLRLKQLEELISLWMPDK